jgi:hypothetical protein
VGRTLLSAAFDFGFDFCGKRISAAIRSCELIHELGIIVRSHDYAGIEPQWIGERFQHDVLRESANRWLDQNSDAHVCSYQVNRLLRRKNLVNAADYIIPQENGKSRYLSSVSGLSAPLHFRYRTRKQWRSAKR